MVKKVKYKPKFKAFIQEGLLIALLVSLVPFFVIVSLSPVDFQKYHIELQKVVPRSGEHIFWYEDLDGDKREEFMFMNNHQKGNLAILTFDSQAKSLGQFNLNSFMPKTTVFLKPIFVDLNNDKVKEIIFFSQNKESVYLNILDYKKSAFILSDRFIAKIGFTKKSKLDYRIEWIDNRDVNNDGIKEIYFSIMAGFGLYPRNIYRYDFANDSLISSPNSAALKASFLFNESTLFVGTHAAANCGSDFPYPYADSLCWIFGYNENLQYAFTPIAFEGTPASFQSIDKTKEGIIAMYYNQSPYGYSAQVIYINKKGEITHRKNTVPSRLYTISIKGKAQQILQEFKGATYFFNTETGTTGEEISDLRNCAYKKSKDIDHDGEPEHFFYNGRFQQLLICRNNFKDIVTINLDLRKEVFLDYSTGIKEDGVEIIVHTTNNVFFYKAEFKSQMQLFC